MREAFNLKTDFPSSGPGILNHDLKHRLTTAIRHSSPKTAQPAPTAPQTLLQTLRTKIRTHILTHLPSESRLISSLQSYTPNPIITLSTHLGSLGSHTAFLLFLPPLFWISQSPQTHIFARHLVNISALGVYLSSISKDYLCLPRPLAPPVQRYSSSKSVSREYGFPSTHTTNAVSIALYIALWTLFAWSESLTTSQQISIIGACILYGSLIPLSRILTGMHSLTDICGGAILAVSLTLSQYFIFMPIVETVIKWDSGLVPIGAGLLGLGMLWTHPYPEGFCPCWEDDVAFQGVVWGVFGGGWRNAGREVTNVDGDLGWGMIALKLLLGTIMIAAYRIVAKKAVRNILTVVYQASGWPVSTVSDPAAETTHDVNVPVAAAAEPAPATGKIHSAPVPASSQKVYVLPMWDVRWMTTYVVYAGIGWMATDGVVAALRLLGL
ncbi:hypothetical protein HK097_007063 [Rhizophlyctis rosea]|uniref:Phosphatidic acid phosphatase type 2/haloperoxidase domain-containing protein n=1 Tax=Rhizophlyctis rosea TaxID=64517 RepID=A0AAD5SF45_9FUNG|nr:hypothetical protein HK097_007063 [Rhizophlyctis rosea]